jgi:hypothetical protein
MIEITGEHMSLTLDDEVVATAEFSRHAGNGQGAWIVSLYPARLYTSDQAITALTVAELRETGHSDGHPLLVALREELR